MGYEAPAARINVRLYHAGHDRTFTAKMEGCDYGFTLLGVARLVAEIPGP